MIQSLFLHIAAGIGGLAIAVRFVPDVGFSGDVQQLLIAGAVLGIINVVVKPILNVLTLPIRILTLGLSSLVINTLLVLAVDIYFEELNIIGLLPLIWTTSIVWILSMLLNLFGKGKVNE
jgi:putative membrane protein